MNWKDIEGYKGTYQISDEVEVRSLDRVVVCKNGKVKKLKGKTIKQCLNTHGYLQVNLCKNGKHLTRKVHKLVAEAFLGPCPPGMEVCHGIGGQLDNRPSNLRYATHSENCRDKVRDGTTNRKPVRCSDGREFASAMEAERQTGVKHAGISRVCNKYVDPKTGQRHLTAGGLGWEFI